MIELKIKKKYFDAILSLKKPFELRHKPIPKGTIVKLICIEEPTKEQQERLEQLNKNSAFGWKLKEHYIIFESGECIEGKIFNICNFQFIKKDKEHPSVWDGENKNWEFAGTNNFARVKSNNGTRYNCEWYDNFCWDYINEKQTYLIEINKIIEVGGN